MIRHGATTIWGRLREWLTRDAVIIPFFILVTVVAAVLLMAALQLLTVSRPSRSAYAALPSEHGLDYWPVSLKSTDGTDLAAWFVPSSTAGRAAILILHGYGSNKSEMLPRVGFLASDYNLLFLDFRYSGESGGDYATFGTTEREDASVALSWLRGQGLDVLGVYGFSLGGTVALTSLAADERVRCAVAETPYGNARAVVSEGYAGFGFLREPMTDITVWLAGLLGYDLSAGRIARDLSSIRRPTLVISSTSDPVIAPEHLAAVRSGLKDNPQAEYLEFSGQTHGEIAPGFVERLQSFYGACLTQ